MSLRPVRVREHFFLLGPGWLPERAREIAREHGAALVNHTEPRCKCGKGCSPGTCELSRQHWFSAPDRGKAENARVVNAVRQALAEAGII